MSVFVTVSARTYEELMWRKQQIHANEALAIQPSFSNANGRYRLRCINTARKEYGKVGEKQYRERRQLQCLR